MSINKFLKSLLKVSIGFATILIFFLVSYTPANAFTTRTGETVTIPKSETIDGTLLVTGQRIRVDGNVNGDIICAGQSVEITGKVEGDVLCGVQNITVSGVVNGNIRSAGQDINISGQIARNVDVFGQNITSAAMIGGEMYVGGQNFSMTGAIAKNLQGSMQSAKIDGLVGRNMNVNVKSLSLGNNAKIHGELLYKSSQQASIASSATTGKVSRSYPPVNDNQNKTGERGSLVISKIISLFTHLLIALLLVAVWPAVMLRVSDSMIMRVGRSIGIGALLLFVTPIVIIAVILTIIGIPIALLLGFAYALALFVSRLFVAITIGREITRNYWKKQKDSLIWSVIIGVIVTWLIYSIPIIGGIASFIAVLWGLGGVYYLFRPAEKK